MQIKHTANKIIFFIFSCILLILNSCTQYKNKPINRGFHNLTSRFNVYFYANESLNEGISKLELNHKDDYTKLLPLSVYGTKESCKEIFPEMDRTIKKSSLCITRHAIKDKKTKQEIYGAVKWIDNAWIALGKAHFYKREYFDAIETFEFVANSYKSKEKYEAWLCLAKVYNEMGLLSQSEPYINLIKNEAKFPKQFICDFEIVYADFYIKQGLNEEAITKLINAVKHAKLKKQKARLLFVLGQLYELRENDNKKAYEQYRKILSLKPTYELEFNSRIKLALLSDYNEQSAKKIKTLLLKMLKDIKNSEYLDVIYYALGQLEERESNIEGAFNFYLKSIENSKSNPIQKSKSYLRIAEINFDKEEYVNSKLYYDSTLAIIDKEDHIYKEVMNKKNSLDVLVGHINTIKTQDSLLKIAQLDSSTRSKFIENLIAKTILEEKKLKEFQELQVEKENQTILNTPTAPFQPSAGNSGAWYFYNMQTKSFGVNDFIKKWGNQRKNEDNWRRQNKASVTESWENVESETKIEQDSISVAEQKEENPQLNPYTYLKNLPLTKELQDSARKKILNAYYSLGTIYREQLNNTKRAIFTFEEMNRRFPKSEYEVSAFYQMYRIYIQNKNTTKAEEYKNYILNLYPKSDYAQLIRDPNFASAVNARKSEVEAFYTQTYEEYLAGNHNVAIQKCNDALKKYSKNDFSPKFAYLRALCIGKIQTVDSLENALYKVVNSYPSSEVTPAAKAILEVIQKKKNPTATENTKQKTIDENEYTQTDSLPHYWAISIPQNRGNANAFKIKLSDFNNHFYSVKKYEIQTIMLETTTLILLKTFSNKSDVLSYYDFILKKQEIFSDLQIENISTFGISESNLILLIKKKNIEGYKTFFNKNYLLK